MKVETQDEGGGILINLKFRNLERWLWQ